MDHYENPRNKKETADQSYKTVHMDSASCIDDIYVQVKLDGEGKIQDFLWHGTACAISTASVSILSEISKGKTASEIENLYGEFFDMLEGRNSGSDDLGEALAFKNTGRQPSRIGCATIGWRGLLKALKEE